jgi:hypothetical protein
MCFKGLDWLKLERLRERQREKEGIWERVSALHFKGPGRENVFLV